MQIIYNIINLKLLPYKWVNILLIISIIVISSVFTFNRLIDPYGTQNYFCDLKYKPVLNERAYKYKYIFYDNNIDKYDSLILGSSRTMKIEPLTNELTKDFFNFSVHVANNAEKLFILEEWLKRKKLKTVYLGIDYYNFHKDKRPLFVDYNNFQNTNSSTYLSVSALKLSYKSLLNKLNKRPQTFFNKDGSINYYNDEKLISTNQYNFSKERFLTASKNYIINNMINDPFVIEENVFTTLHKINQLSQQYHFKLIVFITPMQKEVNNILDTHQDLKNKFIYIKKQLVLEFGTIYDFSGKNSYNLDRTNFYDPFHYRAILGNKIVLRLNHKIDDYGNKLSSTNNK